MKEYLKKRLQEEIKNLPYDPRPELKAAGAGPSLSAPSRKADIQNIKFRIAKAAAISQEFQAKHPDEHYFALPTDGDGFYQVEFRHDGQIKTKHISASADMTQRNGAFQPTDVGTCKTFQNIARYCFVKAGKNGSSVGASPAEDAANKALIIFKQEILDFYDSTGYDDGKSADISKEKMTDKQAKHKEKKDLETQIGRRISDSEWLAYQQSGATPKTKPVTSISPDEQGEFEKRQMMARMRRDAALNRKG